MRLFIKLLFTLTVAFAAAQAHASALSTAISIWDTATSGAKLTAAVDSTVQDSGAFFSQIEKIATVAATKFTNAATDSMYTSGMGLANGLVATALEIGGALALFYLMVQFVYMLGDTGGSIKSVLFDVCVPCIVAALLINGFSGYMDMFRGFLDVLSSGGSDPVAGLVGFYTGALRMIEVTFAQGTKAIIAAISAGSWSTAAIAVVDWMGGFLIAIAVLFVIVTGLAEVFGLIILGPFLFAIGVAFGPIFIAGLVTPWTRNFFTTWLHFIIASAMVTGVTRVVVQVTSGLFLSLQIDSLATGTPVAATLGLIGLIVLTFNAILGQVPGIAQALVPGSFGARSPTPRMAADLAKTTQPVNNAGGALVKQGVNGLRGSGGSRGAGAGGAGAGAGAGGAGAGGGGGGTGVSAQQIASMAKGTNTP
ncbi:type IV secretion system protein [Noviherbaspirillum pedocola]|uniref:Type IV secretion system protein n=1 Tax=Noviherbaspirillum pedocola TaxID=2801341 RepID=A0A934W297_9BURK|nr:type IV secretion system protein [Noviherbaspirillum pedocola]MBK4736076.1 type IV secretion system protein [Noviherbaspirillum pedocola]